MQCVQCGSIALETTEHSITCQQCNTIYNIFHDVPVLFADVMTQTVHQAPSEEFASWLADTMFLPNNRETIVKLQAIFSTTYRFGEFSLDAENQFLERLQNCGIEISREGVESNNQPKTSNLLGKLYERIRQTDRQTDSS